MKISSAFLLYLWTLFTGSAFSQPPEQQRFLRSAAWQLDSGFLVAGDGVLTSIGDRRIVLIGEFNHGSHEVFAVQDSLIRFLHEKLGFTHVLFEAGLGEVGVIHLSMHDRTEEQLTYGFFGGWRTTERQHLMGYLRDQQMPFGGYDVQRTGSVFTDHLSSRLDELDYFESLELRFLEIKGELARFQTIYDSVAPETIQLILDYRELKDTLPPEETLEIRTLENRITYLQYMLDFARTKDWNERWKQRDLAMAQNIRWWIDRIPEQEKVIILGHNFHIARYNAGEEVMGEFLANDYGSDMYSIGIFAAGGNYLDNSGTIKQMTPADSMARDLTSVIQQIRAETIFLAIPDQPVPGSDWLFNDIIINDTFIDLSGTNHLNLSESFDALILLQQVSPAHKPEN